MNKLTKITPSQIFLFPHDERTFEKATSSVDRAIRWFKDGMEIPSIRPLLNFEHVSVDVEGGELKCVIDNMLPKQRIAEVSKILRRDGSHNESKSPLIELILNAFWEHYDWPYWLSCNLLLNETGGYDLVIVALTE